MHSSRSISPRTESWWRGAKGDLKAESGKVAPRQRHFTMKTFLECFMCSYSAAGRVMLWCLGRATQRTRLMNGKKRILEALGRSWKKYTSQRRYQHSRRWVIDFPRQLAIRVAWSLHIKREAFYELQLTEARQKVHPQLHFTISVCVCSSKGRAWTLSGWLSGWMTAHSTPGMSGNLMELRQVVFCSAPNRSKIERTTPDGTHTQLRQMQN